jgi:hypothetical protein
VFAGGLITGDLFPAIKDKAEHKIPIEQLFTFADPAELNELAKLLIWCFIAGFAERLIPDTLNRMVVRKVAVLTTQEPKTEAADVTAGSRQNSQTGKEDKK